jgi:2,3-bisphosphoglycerate-dependent phosphoglycerate mutase
MGRLILVRHGESRWNLANKFTGWVDVPLSPRGIKEAMMCAKKLKGLSIDVAFTSKLTRAQETLLIILAEQKYTGIFLHKAKKRKAWGSHVGQLERDEIWIYSDNALNERYYGKLQGLNKDYARKKFGKEKVFKWRRSFDVCPPGGECLKDTYKRAVPYFKKYILSRVKKEDVIVSAHGNSLRAIIKYVDGIPDEDVPFLELPTGKPIIYKYHRGRLVKQSGPITLNRPIKWKK